MNEPTVFISHSFQDREWVRQFARRLSELGAAVVFDDDAVKAGDEWEALLERKLRQSDVVVSLLDEDAPSPNSLFELGAAIGLGKRVVGIVPEGQQANVPFRPSQRLVKGSPEATAQELISRAA